jgi:hypothetical protein
MLRVYEFDSSVIPGSYKDWFEVYQDDDVLDAIYLADSLDKAMKFCYDSGQNFEVHTLQAYYNEYGEE